VDRPGRPLGLLIAALAGLAGTIALGAGPRPTLQALTWIAPGREATALARQPATCLAAAADDPQVESGMALFNSPQLLGGQAARAGVSCASCHSNGRRNVDFQLAVVSDGPGTADVSQSFFSVARGNRRFDPKPIPDLALPGKISRNPGSSALTTFLHGLIVEEFSGREPGEAALADLAAYVRAIQACPSRSEQARSVSDQLALFRASVRGAARASAAGDPQSANVLIGGARWQLGLIDERLAPFGHASERKALLRTSRELQTILDETKKPPRLNALQTKFDRTIAPALGKAEARSLYREVLVRRWLAGR